MKYCKFCGEQIHEDAVICPKCGRQVEILKQEQQPNVVINNTNMNTNVNGLGKPKDKMISIILCCIGFVAIAGLHKFYEGKIFMGILYLFTFGFIGIGTVIDLIILICKPSTYYV